MWLNDSQDFLGVCCCNPLSISDFASLNILTLPFS